MGGNDSVEQIDFADPICLYAIHPGILGTRRKVSRAGPDRECGWSIAVQIGMVAIWTEIYDARVRGINQCTEGTE